jgi:hypothetical protein
MSSHAHNHKTSCNAFEEQANRKHTHISFLKNIADAMTAATAASRVTWHLERSVSAEGTVFNICEESQKSDYTKQTPTNTRPVQST